MDIQTGHFRSALAVLALSSAAGAATAQQVVEVQMAPAQVTLKVGAKTSVLATAYDGKGNVLPSAKVTCVSSDLRVVRSEADPSATGVCNLFGVKDGLASVEAQSGTQKATVVVQVVPAAGSPAVAPPPARSAPSSAAAVIGNATVVKLQPSTIVLLPSEAQQLAVQFLRDDGSAATPSSLTWKSLQPAVASVDSNGLIVAISPGQGLVEVSTPNGLTARSPVEVAQTAFSFTRTALSLSPGTVDTIRVYVPAQGNRAIAGAALQWATTDTLVARVSPLGVVTAVGPGRATIRAAGFVQEHTLPVTVHRPVTTLEVSPGLKDSVLVPVGGPVHFSARPLGADKTEVTEATVTFDLADTSVAAYDVATGNVTGKKIGVTKFRIHAPGKGLDTAWTLSVIAGGIKVDAPRVGLDIGGKQKVAALFTDGRGRTIAPASGVTWVSEGAAVATVDPDGTITGAGFGSTYVLVRTPWGRTDSVHVFVEGEILVSSNRAGSSDIYAFDRAQPNRMIQLTHDSAAEVAATYSPDGTRIAYVSTRDGNPEIYVMNADGTGAQRLTTTPAHEDSPSWTPDGRQIVFASDRSGKMEIWAMGADGSAPHQLTPDAAINYQPTVSPDGQTIAFTSARDGNYEVYLMALDGTNQRNITQDPKAQSAPAWITSGQLAFLSERTAQERVVMRKTLATGELVAIGQPSLVTGFAISRTGDLLALTVAVVDGEGHAIQKLFLQPVGAGLAAPLEVPRIGVEQFQTPSFKH